MTSAPPSATGAPTSAGQLNSAHAWAGAQVPARVEAPEKVASADPTSRWAPWADAGLWAVACSGFALSYSSVQRAALAHVDHEALSYLLPIATDGGALAAAARYVADRRAGITAARGWQLLAWAAIAASAALNAMGRDAQDAVWHLVGPAALAVITELYAHRAAQLRKRELDGARETIPARLWLTSPMASARLWLWVARTGERSLVTARQEMGRHAAALEALDTDCPGREYRRMRRVARRQLRSGALPPVAVLHVLGWGDADRAPADPPAALKALLVAALAPTASLKPAADEPTHGAGHPPTVHIAVLDRAVGNPDPSGVEAPNPVADEHAPGSVAVGRRSTGDSRGERTISPRDERSPHAEHALPVEHASLSNGHVGRGHADREHIRPVTLATASTPGSGGTYLDPVEEHAPQHGVGGRSASDAPTAAGMPRSDAEIARLVATDAPLPSVRRIKAIHRVGNTRAARIRYAAERLAASTPATADDAAGPEAVTAPPVADPPVDDTSTTTSDNPETPSQERNPADEDGQQQNPEHQKQNPEQQP